MLYSRLDDRAHAAPPGEADFSSSWDRGVDQMQATLFAAANAVGEATGVDMVAKWGEEGMRRNLDEVAQNPPKIRDWDDVDSLAAFGDYVLERFGEQLPQLLPDAAILVGGTLTSGGGGIAAVAARRAALSTAEKAAIGKGFKRMVGERGFSTFAGKRAALAAVTANQVAQGIGETQIQLLDEGVDSPESAIVAGALKGALDRVGLEKLMGLGRTTGMSPAKLGEQIIKAAGVEATTETAQGVVDMLAIKANKPDYDLFSVDNLKQLREAAIVGGLMGGGLGGVQAGAHFLAAGKDSPTPEPQETIDAQARAVADPTSTKDTMEVTGGSPAPTVDIPGAIQVPTENGVAITTNPQKAEQIAATGGDQQTMGDTLFGMPEGKAGTDGTAVQVLDAAGNPVAEALTNEAEAASVVERLKSQAPAGGSVRITRVEQVVSDRAARTEPPDAPAASAAELIPAEAVDQALADDAANRGGAMMADAQREEQRAARIAELEDELAGLRQPAEDPSYAAPDVALQPAQANVGDRRRVAANDRKTQVRNPDPVPAAPQAPEPVGQPLLQDDELDALTDYSPAADAQPASLVEERDDFAPVEPEYDEDNSDPYAGAVEERVDLGAESGFSDLVVSDRYSQPQSFKYQNQADEHVEIARMFDPTRAYEAVRNPQTQQWDVVPQPRQYRTITQARRAVAAAEEKHPHLAIGVKKVEGGFELEARRLPDAIESDSTIIVKDKYAPVANMTRQERAEFGIRRAIYNGRALSRKMAFGKGGDTDARMIMHFYRPGSDDDIITVRAADLTTMGQDLNQGEAGVMQEDQKHLAGFQSGVAAMLEAGYSPVQNIDFNAPAMRNLIVYSPSTNYQKDGVTVDTLMKARERRNRPAVNVSNMEWGIRRGEAYVRDLEEQNSPSNPRGSLTNYSEEMLARAQLNELRGAHRRRNRQLQNDPRQTLSTADEDATFFDPGEIEQVAGDVDDSAPARIVLDNDDNEMGVEVAPARRAQRSPESVEGQVEQAQVAEERSARTRDELIDQPLQYETTPPRDRAAELAQYLAPTAEDLKQFGIEPDPVPTAPEIQVPDEPVAEAPANVVAAVDEVVQDTNADTRSAARAARPATIATRTAARNQGRSVFNRLLRRLSGVAHTPLFQKGHNRIARVIYTRHGELETINKDLAAEFYRSTNTRGKQALLDAIYGAQSEWYGRLERAMRPFDIAEVRSAFDQLVRELPDDQLTPAGAALRRLIESYHRDYASPRMPTLGHVERYFPRLYTEKVETHQLELVTLLGKHGIKDPKSVAENLMGQRDGVETDPLAFMAQRGRVQMQRMLKDPALIDDLVNGGYLNTDPVATLVSYIRTTSRRAEFEGRYGKYVVPTGWEPNKPGSRRNAKILQSFLKNAGFSTLAEAESSGQAKMSPSGDLTWYEPNRGLEELIAATTGLQSPRVWIARQRRQAKKELAKLRQTLQHLPSKQVDEAVEQRGEELKKQFLHDYHQQFPEYQRVKSLIQGVLGTLPVDKNSMSYKVLGEVQAFEALRTLLFAGLSSIVDPASVVARTKGVLSAKEIAHVFRDVASHYKDHKALAADLGHVSNVLSNAAIEYGIFSPVGGAPQGFSMRRLLPTFFTLNGNEAVVNFTKTLSIAVGRRFLARIADDAVNGTGIQQTRAKRYLEELRVTPEHVSRWVANNFAYDTDLVDPVDVTAARMSQRALARFVRETVMMPNGAEEPHWAAHPLGGTIMYLKRFTYAFNKNVLRGFERELIARYREQGMTREAAAQAAMWLLPTLAVFMALGGLSDELRQRIMSLGEKGTLDKNRNDPAKVADAWARRAGLADAVPFLPAVTNPTPSNIAFQAGPLYSHFFQLLDNHDGRTDHAVVKNILDSLPVVNQLPGLRKLVYQQLESA